MLRVNDIFCHKDSLRLPGHNCHKTKWFAFVHCCQAHGMQRPFFLPSPSIQAYQKNPGVRDDASGLPISPGLSWTISLSHNTSLVFASVLSVARRVQVESRKKKYNHKEQSPVCS